RAVSIRRSLSEEDLKAFGALDEEAIAAVEQEIWPDVRSVDELADTVRELFFLPEQSLPVEWKDWMNALIQSGRVVRVGNHFVSMDRGEIAGKALKGEEGAAAQALRAWLMVGGPATAEAWARKTGLDLNTIQTALLRLEAGGVVLRGKFRKSAVEGG